MRKLKFSLLSKAIAATILILLPVVITFAASYRTNRTLLEKHLLEDLTIIAEGFESQTYQYLEMTRRRAEDFATDGSVISALKSGQEGSKALSEHLLANKLPLDKQIHAIAVISPSGKMVASTDPSLGSTDFGAFRSLFSAKGAAGILELERGTRGLPELIVSAPVKGPENEFLGTLANFILLSELEDVFTGEIAKNLGAITSGSGPKHTLEAYLVNRDGLMLTGSKFIEGAALSQKVESTPVKACVDQGAEMTGFYADYRGVKVAGASMCMPSLGWTLLIEIDAEEALYPATAMKKKAVVGAGAVVILICVLLLIFFKTIIAQLRGVTEAALRISRGDYATRVPVRSTDEIGLLAEAFNDMAGQIKERNEALTESENRLSKAQKIARLGSWEWDITGNTLWWSDEIYAIFGLDRNRFGATYESFIKAVHPQDREFVENSVHQALFFKRPYSIDHRIVLPDGEVRAVHENADILFDDAGRPVRMTGTVQDITERKKSEFELKKLSAVIEHSVNVVFITDTKGTIEYVNPTFEQVTGYAKEEAVGQTPKILASGEVAEPLYKEMWTTILSGQTWRGTIKNRNKTGALYWVTSVITPIKDEQGEITHFLAVQEDVTARMLSDERIRYLANYDELTGLVNRSRFIELVEEWANMAAGTGKKAAMCLMDTDQFKLLNDSFGHGAGDEYLRRLANVLKERVGRIYAKARASFDAEPVLSRLSGDEFAVYLPGLTETEGMEAAEELRKAVEALYFTESESSFTASLGIAFFPSHGTNVKELLTKADAAMYRAKERGRNRVHAYRDEDHDLEKMHSRLAWKEKITQGLRESRFNPWFQPILDLETGTVHHYEALARLTGEDGKVVLPGSFIDIAERFGLVGLIDRMIIEKSMKKQAEMLKKGLSLSFAMNLSGKDLGDPDLLDFIKLKIKETGADPASLVFEITETAAIGDLEKATKFVRALKELGCHFSLDDFGVGFTSFTYLKELRVDFIKIDGSFIKKLHESHEDRVFVKAITDLAAGLRIKSVAEFVENEKGLELLKSFGVGFAQGYLIGKPSPELQLAGERFALPAKSKKAAS